MINNSIKNSSLVDLKVFVVNSSVHITSILCQEGIPYASNNWSIVKNDLSEIATIFVDRELNNSEEKIILEFVSNGGAVIYDNLSAKAFSKYTRENKLKKIKICDCSIEADSFEKGYFLHIDFDFSKLSGCNNAIMKLFKTISGEVLERVALFSKAKARKLLLNALLLANELRNMPFVRFWYYPDKFKTAFNFRFDLDEDTDGDLDVLRQVSSIYKDCSTMFVCGSSFESNADKIRQMITDGYDIQSHAYHHHTYKSFSQNSFNIDKSIEYFKKMNYEAEGYASPKGYWNRGLAKALEARGFLYASEFSYDYDNFPEHPLVNNINSTVLQIPIHPVCPGIFLDAGITDDKIIFAYFKDIILRKYRNSQTIFLYSHPNEKLQNKSSFWRSVFDYATSLDNVWRVNLSGFAKWWKDRAKLEFEKISFDRKTGKLLFVLKQNCDLPQVSVSINKNAESAVLYPLSGVQTNELDFNSLDYTKWDAGFSYEGAYLEAPQRLSFSKWLKDFLVQVLDWEECTPVHQIIRDTPAANIKFLLRKMRMDKLKLNI